jgi:hypothetical protein
VYKCRERTSGNLRATSRSSLSSSRMPAGDLRKSPLSVYTLRGSGDPALAASTRLLSHRKPHAPSIAPHTLCSMLSFFATLSKYPSHVFLNRSRTSFSISSSSVSTPSGGNAVSAASFTSRARGLDSWVASIGFEVAGSNMPRKGRAYDLRNVVRRGKDDREGSLDNCQALDQVWCDPVAKKAY